MAARDARQTKPAADRPVFCTVRLEEPVAEKFANRLKADGRAHALFDLWRNLVSQPNAISFMVRPEKNSKVRFHSCAECGAPFTNADQVLRHFRYEHAAKSVKTVEKAIDPPKGNFQFIARCGLCRALLCPPNYHGFTAKLTAHHQERHDQVPFDEFRARASNSSFPDDIEAWRKAASVIEELHCAHCDQLLADDREATEHFKNAHADRITKVEDELLIHASRVKQLECRDLRRACTETWDWEKKAPGHFLALLRHALSQKGLQIFRDILGHQFACRYRPRHVSPRDQLTPRQQEMLALAAAPARRGHKPNRHTLRDHFAAQGVSEQDVKADVDALVTQGLLVEFDTGQLDALGPGSHIESK